MERFYGGKKCVIEKKMTDVKWAHMLDAASTTSNHRVSQTLIGFYDMLLTMNKQLSEMLARNLREDRHPRHASEVRENLIPRTSFLLSVQLFLTKPSYQRPTDDYGRAPAAIDAIPPRGYSCPHSVLRAAASELEVSRVKSWPRRSWPTFV